MPNEQKNLTEIDDFLLELLVCPVSGETLFYDREKQLLISRKASLAYPVTDGIPIMIIEEAKKI